jgi:hypothetical protein
VPVLALVQHYFQPTVAGAVTEQPDAPCGQEIAGDVHPLLHPLDQRSAGDATDLNVVGLLQLARRVGNTRRPIGVVGKQKQTLAGLVQPSNRGDKGQTRSREAFKHRGSALLVRSSGDEPARLVQCQVQPGRGAKQAPIHCDLVPVEVHAPFKFPANFPVDPHAPGRN